MKKTILIIALFTAALILLLLTSCTISPPQLLPENGVWKSENPRITVIIDMDSEDRGRGRDFKGIYEKPLGEKMNITISFLLGAPYDSVSIRCAIPNEQGGLGRLLYSGGYSLEGDSFYVREFSDFFDRNPNVIVFERVGELGPYSGS